MKENDIWWQGVVWDQYPGRLRVYLPGAFVAFEHFPLPVRDASCQRQGQGPCQLQVRGGL